MLIINYITLSNTTLQNAIRYFDGYDSGKYEMYGSMCLIGQYADFNLPQLGIKKQTLGRITSIVCKEKFDIVTIVRQDIK